MEPIKDEMLEHREGQKLFTTQRIIFAVALGAVLAGVAIWLAVGKE
jgi:hypothetical protein